MGNGVFAAVTLNGGRTGGTANEEQGGETSSAASDAAERPTGGDAQRAAQGRRPNGEQTRGRGHGRPPPTPLQGCVAAPQTRTQGFLRVAWA